MTAEFKDKYAGQKKQCNPWRIFIKKGARKAETDASCPPWIPEFNKVEFTGLHSSIRNNCSGLQRVSTGSRISKGTPPTSCSATKKGQYFQYLIYFTQWATPLKQFKNTS